MIIGTTEIIPLRLRKGKQHRETDTMQTTKVQTQDHSPHSFQVKD